MRDEPVLDLIDAHVHLYRTLEVEKASVVVAGRRDRDRWAHPEAVDAYLDSEGISGLVCLPNFPTRQMRSALLDRSASTPEMVEDTLKGRLRRHNEWMCELAASNERLVVAISVQMLLSSDEMVEEVRLGKERGARAVKLLPGMYREWPDDQAFWPMYETCQDLGMPVVSDTGTLGAADAGGTSYGEPARFERVLEAFPRLILVMAHFPSAFWDQRLELAKRYPQLHFDTSGSFYDHGLEVRDKERAASVTDATRLMRSVGIDRFMFGSDGPRAAFRPALERVLALDLSTSEQRQLLSENARRVYRI